MRYLAIFAILLSAVFAQVDSETVGIGAATRLNMLRLQRMEIIKALGAEGKFKSPQDLTTALKSDSITDPRLATLKNLNTEIHSLRINGRQASTPNIEGSARFGLRYRENQQKIQQYKRVYQNAQSAGADADAIQDLKLMQRRLYMERSELTLKHQLLEDGTFPSIQKLNQGVSANHADPRVKALAKVQQDLGKINISRSQSNRVGQLTKEYLLPVKPAKAGPATMPTPPPANTPQATVVGASPASPSHNLAQPQPATPIVRPVVNTQPAVTTPKVQTTLTQPTPTVKISQQPTVAPIVRPATRVQTPASQASPSVRTVQPLPSAPVVRPVANATATIATPRVQTTVTQSTPIVKATPQPTVAPVKTPVSPASPSIRTVQPQPSAAVVRPVAITQATVSAPRVLPQPTPTVRTQPPLATSYSASVRPPVGYTQASAVQNPSMAQVLRSHNANLQPRGIAVSNPAMGRSAGFNPAGIIESSIGAELKPIATELHQGIKTNSIQDYIESVKTTGNKVTDKVLGGAGDEATGRDGYEVRRDAVVKSLQEKVASLSDDIANANANGNSSKAQKLQSLKDTLDIELQKAQVSPQGLQLKAEISSLQEHINGLKAGNGDKNVVKSLQDQLSAKEAELGKLSGDSKAVAKNYIRDGLHFAVISAATQGVLNIVEQVKNGEDVNLGNAFDFITTPDFLLGTSGAFAGGLLVQKALTTGMGKIAMATVQNMVPGPIKFIVQALPYTIGAMVGSDLMTGNLGRHSVTDMVFNGIGSSVGMMLGSAIFPPIGSIAGSVLGAMAGDYISKMIQGKDPQEVAVEMAYEPQWQELTDPAWEEQDAEDMMLSLHPDPTSAAINRVSHPANSETLVDLQRARDAAYSAYRDAVSRHGQKSEIAVRAHTLYMDFDTRVKNFRK